MPLYRVKFWWRLVSSFGGEHSNGKLRCIFTSWFGVFRRISPDVLDRFSQFFHHMKALYVPMIDLDFFFRYLKGRCYGNQFCAKIASCTFVALAFRNVVVQRISSNISGCTGPIFAIFSPYESILRADDWCVPYFPICQGMLPWEPNIITVMKVNWYYVHSLHVRHMVARFARGRHCGAERAIS